MKIASVIVIAKMTRARNMVTTEGKDVMFAACTDEVEGPL
jgi:hypothetical protein